MQPPSHQSPNLVNPGQPELRTLLQYSVRLAPQADGSDPRRAAIPRIKAWIRGKVDWLSEADLAQSEFEQAPSGQKLQWLWDEAEGRWGMCLVQPDAPPQWRREQGDEPVAGRHWRTDIALWPEAESGQVRLGLRVTVISYPQARGAPVSYSRPYIIRQLRREVGLWDATTQLAAAPHAAADAAALQQWADFLRAPTRRLPIVVITPLGQKRAAALNLPAGQPLLAPAELAERLEGLAHVLVLDREQARQWTTLLGQELTVYDGAVRLYPAGLTLSDTYEGYAPRWLPDRIAYFIFDQKEREDDATLGPDAFQRYLRQRIYGLLERQKLPHHLLLTYDDVRQAYRTRLLNELRQQLQASPEAEEYAHLLAQENEDLNKQVAALQEEADHYAQQHDQKDEEAQTLRAEMHHLQKRIQSLKYFLAQDNVATDTFEPPERYEDFPPAIADRFPDRLILMGRAKRGLKNAHYNDPAEVWRALELLAGPYWEMRMGYEGAKERYESMRQALKVEVSRAVGETVKGQYAAQYIVNYPEGTPQQRTLNMHLTKGGGHDERYCLRIYFFWDEEMNRVVVGWLPSHLANSLS
jgi:hypothetical protein